MFSMPIEIFEFNKICTDNHFIVIVEKQLSKIFMNMKIFIHTQASKQ